MSAPTYDFTNPLIVQSDRTLLLETENDKFADCRDAIARFAELEKSPEQLHTYRITSLSVWNAKAAGMDGGEMVAALESFAKYPLPPGLAAELDELASRFGALALIEEGGGLSLVAGDRKLLDKLAKRPAIAKHLDGTTKVGYRVKPAARGEIKHQLIKLDYPVDDRAGYVGGKPLAIALDGVDLRPYQSAAARAFWGDGGSDAGTGLVVLPCGAGKTIVGIAAMSLVGAHTLVLTTGRTSVGQWKREIVEKTSLTEDDVGEYTGASKALRPVTITTYNILTYRKSNVDAFEHFALFRDADWGLIVYDEVHLLPAPVFRATAELQTRRRLGLTATLVREDGREREVFSLVGPKRFDLPWKALEAEGWIATARCYEVRVELTPEQMADYKLATARAQSRMASENPAKVDVVKRLLAKHRDDRVLVIGAFLKSLRDVADAVNAPIITGDTPQAERDRHYRDFRDGTTPVLVVSKVANFAIDLPDANVAIEISGTFGSRQEEAQRLGRVLRPKKDGGEATFYALVTKGTKDQEFAINRQRFLVEQGYAYEVIAPDAI